MLFENHYATNCNLGRISHRFRDNVSFPLKHAFLSPFPFNFEFENVPLALDGRNFARLCL